MADKTIVDQKIFETMAELATKDKQDHAKRDDNIGEMNRAFLFDWDEEENFEEQVYEGKVTLSPDAFNQTMGVIRLMIATDPQISMPPEVNDELASQFSDEYEGFARGIWQQSGRIFGMPIHYDLVMASILYAEAHTVINSTREMVKMGEKVGGAYQKRAEAIAKKTKYLITSPAPEGRYPIYDELGIVRYSSCVETTLSQVRQEFGELADAIIGSRKLTEDVKLWRGWDWENHAVWVEGQESAPLYARPHNLPIFPVRAQITSGSRLFDKPEDRRIPFMYALIKSGLWNRQNLALSVLYTLVFSIGSNPMTIAHLKDPNKRLNIDRSHPGGILKLELGESLSQFEQNPLNPALAEALSIAERKGIESTIFRQALGEPMGSNTPFSTVSLMHQAGRLPLMSFQRLASWLIGDTLTDCLLWEKHYAESEGETESEMRYRAEKGRERIRFDGREIPDDLEIEATLDVELPQDKGELARLAGNLTDPRNPLTSRRYAQEEFLGISDPDEMNYQIIKEQYLTQFVQEQFVELQAQMKARLEEMARASAPPETAEGMPDGAGLSPEEAALLEQQAQQQAAAQGQMQLPPEMMR